jgi:hypothetical protein
MLYRIRSKFREIKTAARDAGENDFQ